MIIFECDNKFCKRSKNREQNGFRKWISEKRLHLLYPNNHTLEITTQKTISIKL